MLFIQMTGLSGAGKSTVSYRAKAELEKLGFKTEVIDGDEYRKTLCRDLGFSKEDRLENIRRLGFVGQRLVENGVIVILSAINPYEEGRRELKLKTQSVKTVWLDCPVEELTRRDTKGLYRQASLPDSDPEKLHNLTGVNDPFDDPTDADLIIRTDLETEDESTARLLDYILANLAPKPNQMPKALFIGRWQPFHNGHKWLIDRKLRAKTPVLIAVRDVPPDDQNPLTTSQTVAILHELYEGCDVEVIVIPNIESVNFGRGVGYAINEFSPPAEVGGISATEVRKGILSGNEAWREVVDPRIHDLILKYLK